MQIETQGKGCSVLVGAEVERAQQNNEHSVASSLNLRPKCSMAQKAANLDQPKSDAVIWT